MRRRVGTVLAALLLFGGLLWPVQALAAEPTLTPPPSASPTTTPTASQQSVQAAVPPTATPQLAPQSLYGLRDALDPGFAAYYGGYYEVAGAVVTIRLRSVPATAQVHVGICTDVSFGSCLGWQPVVGGSGSAAWAITQPGTFYLAVWNEGPEAITYTGTVGV